MPCLGETLFLGTALVGYAQAAGLPIIAAPTVVGEPFALAALLVATVTLFVAGMKLADCLENAERHQEAETLRRELDLVKEEMRRLRR
jgi:uncharacterized membrane protein YccF (DUF307 family)